MCFKRYNDLIWIFLSLSFASKEDLGWDMSIKSTLNATNDERLYNIEVGGQHYHTSESDIVFGEKADDLVTSATRIWKAKRDTDGADVIIKDFWPSDERETEDAIREKILDDIEGSKKRKFFRRHTLKPISAGRVKCNGKDDHTKDTILHGISPTQAYEIFPPNNSEEKKSGVNLLKEYKFWREACALPSTSSLQFAEMKVFGILFHRYHHRVVYTVVAIPFHRLRNLEDMVLVLSQSVEGMYNNPLGFWYLILFFSPSSST